MKRNLVLSAVLLFASLSALGQISETRRPARFANPILDDVVQMSRAELPNETILAFVRARRARLETDVTGEDLIALHRSGVSNRVVEYIASVSGLEDRTARQDREPAASQESSGSSAAPVEPSDGAVEAVPEPYGSVYDGWGWGAYPYWYAYSPFFYGGIVIAGGGHHHRRHHFDRGGGHHNRGGDRSWHSGGHRWSGGNRGGGNRGGSHHGGGSQGRGGHGHR
jgi:hypothetical protein